MSNNPSFKFNASSVLYVKFMLFFKSVFEFKLNDDVMLFDCLFEHLKRPVKEAVRPSNYVANQTLLTFRNFELSIP